MQRSRTKKSPFSDIKQVGIVVVVKDIKRAMEYYLSLGIGPFESLPSGEVPTYTGKNYEVKQPNSRWK